MYRLSLRQPAGAFPEISGARLWFPAHLSPGLDFDLDPAVPLGYIALHDLDQRLGRRLYAHRYTHIDPLVGASDHFSPAERPWLFPSRIPKRHFQACFRHKVAAHHRHPVLQVSSALQVQVPAWRGSGNLAKYARLCRRSRRSSPDPRRQGIRRSRSARLHGASTRTQSRVSLRPKEVSKADTSGMRR